MPEKKSNIPMLNNSDAPVTATISSSISQVFLDLLSQKFLS